MTQTPNQPNRPRQITRTKKTKDFTRIRNKTLRDTRLSLKATGLLALLLSYPDDWKFWEGHLVKQKIDGKRSFSSAYKELIAAGYVKRHRTRQPNGRFTTIVKVYEKPRTPKGGNPQRKQPHGKNGRG